MKEGGILIGKLLSSSASATAATQSASSSAASLSTLILGVLLERSGLRGLQTDKGATSGCFKGGSRGGSGGSDAFLGLEDAISRRLAAAGGGDGGRGGNGGSNDERGGGRGTRGLLSAMLVLGVTSFGAYVLLRYYSYQHQHAHQQQQQSSASTTTAATATPAATTGRSEGGGGGEGGEAGGGAEADGEGEGAGQRRKTKRARLPVAPVASSTPVYTGGNWDTSDSEASDSETAAPFAPPLQPGPAAASPTPSGVSSLTSLSRLPSGGELGSGIWREAERLLGSPRPTLSPPPLSHAGDLDDEEQWDIVGYEEACAAAEEEQLPVGGGGGIGGRWRP